MGTLTRAFWCAAHLFSEIKHTQFCQRVLRRAASFSFTTHLVKIAFVNAPTASRYHIINLCVQQLPANKMLLLFTTLHPLLDIFEHNNLLESLALKRLIPGPTRLINTIQFHLKRRPLQPDILLLFTQIASMDPHHLIAKAIS